MQQMSQYLVGQMFSLFSVARLHIIKKCRLKCKPLLLWHDVMRCANRCGSQADFGCVTGCMTSDKYSGDASTVVHFERG